MMPQESKNSSINLDKINMSGQNADKNNISKFDQEKEKAQNAKTKHILSDSDSLSSSEDSGNFKLKFINKIKIFRIRKPF
jgi:hypothetical protein